MPIEYYGLGASKKLRDIVFAGSHDAGITSGSGNAQTQSLDIFQQAQAGIRLFDLRILARTVNNNGNKTGELVSYHGSHSDSTKTRSMRGTGQDENIVRSKMRTGTFGMALVDMLNAARRYVAQNNEFLIFKFDKCTNYDLIARTCEEILQDGINSTYLYTDGGSINTKTLSDLKGKVICVFPKAGLAEIADIPGKTKSERGFLGFSNLVKGGDYDGDFEGLQYFGKGGTSLNPFKGGITQTGKMDENQRKQLKLLNKMNSQLSPYSSDVIGMMYWTSTGIFGNINARNNVMWQRQGAGLNAMWTQGLQECIDQRVQANRIKGSKHGGIKCLKTFMPNIVMIDFADENKGQIIYDLNLVAEQTLSEAYASATAS
jgi:hypothetical protein